MPQKSNYPSSLIMTLSFSVLLLPNCESSVMLPVGIANAESTASPTTNSMLVGVAARPRRAAAFNRLAAPHRHPHHSNPPRHRKNKRSIRTVDQRHVAG